MQDSPAIERNVSLKPYNTFGLDVKASQFVHAETVEELKAAIAYGKAEGLPLLILGGGSNVLLTQDVEGLVVVIGLKGISIVRQDSDSVVLEAMAGEQWHDLVLDTLHRGYGGLENLSLIPGTVGAAPMQNIGAYGVEIKDTFLSLQALNLETLELKTFDHKGCNFGYRYSRFKGEDKGKYIILSVRFKLSKRNHKLSVDYGAIRNTLKEMGVQKPRIQDISKAVIAIRQSKLPDPAEIGNSGSFFKNPSIAAAQYDELKAKHPKMPGFAQKDGTVKVPAGWLIDQAGWKGHERNGIGVHKLQALVLVNYGSGKGSDIWQLAQEIQADIQSKYGVTLEPEVNIL